jgi:hypothetical protein
MEFAPHSLGEVLAVAQIHPFYEEEIQYPPDEQTVQAVREIVANKQTEHELKSRPIIWKKDL